MGFGRLLRVLWGSYLFVWWLSLFKTSFLFSFFLPTDLRLVGISEFFSSKRFCRSPTLSLGQLLESILVTNMKLLPCWSVLQHIRNFSFFFRFFDLSRHLSVIIFSFSI